MIRSQTQSDTISLLAFYLIYFFLKMQIYYNLTISASHQYLADMPFLLFFMVLFCLLFSETDCQALDGFLYVCSICWLCV